MATPSGLRLDLNPPARSTWMVVALCWAAILSEGYDVGVMGAIVPTLLATKTWGLTPVQVGALGSYALLGMLFGGFLAGTLSDLYGRKRMFLACVPLFSLSMIVAALAPSPTVFALARLIGGLGLGGIIPVVAAYTVEFSPAPQRGFNYGVMYSGYSLGILLAALIAIATLSLTGWRGVVGFGALGLIVTPIAAWKLPESIEFLISRNQIDAARAVASRLGIVLPDQLSVVRAPHPTARRIASSILTGRSAIATILFWVAIALGLLNVYGLATWLPQIMRRSGYDLGSSLSFLAVFSLASAIGGMLVGGIADMRGKRVIVAGAYVIGAIGIAALSLKGSLLVNYILIALAGLGSISASLILTAFIAEYYPPGVRTAATGWAMAAARFGAMSGPLLGGYLAATHLDVAWNFYAFSGVALVAGIAVILVPRNPHVA